MGYRCFLTLLISFLFTVSFGKENYKIGFSQCGQRDSWRLNMEAEMERELLFHPELTLVIKQALDDSELQLRQIDELVKQGIDLLIISPNEINPIQDAIEKVYKKGIPVILVDRRIDSENFTAYVGGDNYEIGRLAAAYIGSKLNYQGKVLEIQGAMTISAAEERSKGFNDELSQYSDLKNVFKIHSFWNENIIADSLPDGFKRHPDINAIFAFNDDLAIEAVDVIHAHHVLSNIVVVGVDGLPTPEGGISMVEEGILTATIIYPTGGREAIQLASKILHEEPYEKYNSLPTTLVDESNVKITRQQFQNISDLQLDINKSMSMLKILNGRYHIQQILLFVLLVLFIVMIVFLIMYLSANKKLKLSNISLEKQKSEISTQNSELIRLGDELEETTQAKLRFFTNISHEFRTPLTLLLGPVNDMESDPSLNETNKWRLNLIHKNARRLMKLINQLMDFRKMEMGKMKLLAGEYDMVKFLQSFKDDFQNLASEKGIHLEFKTETENLMVWFDQDHMDKVFFNLLSNALKFTDKGGTISIQLIQGKNSFSGMERECVSIMVEDNGRGMSKEHLDKIFDRFYQIEQNENRREGTGIGLSLTKGFIEVHKGNIEVWSEKGKGTRFTIYLQMGNDHFSSDEILLSQELDLGKKDGLITPELSGPVSSSKTKNIAESTYKPVVLIVEDDPELREYIKQSLIEKYSIEEAENGKEGLAILEEKELDLIITDVMMPEMNGLEFTRIIKSKIETCHIPVIMLTAKTSEEQIIEGVEQGADDYITKPFNSNYLHAKIHQLIENKNSIKKFFKKMGAKMPQRGLSKMDKGFITHVNEIIEQNINNEQFGVELLGEKSGMSRVHLYRKMKQLTELSPNDYIRSVRLKKAVHLIVEENISISEAAYKTGFSTPSYFSKCFKDMYHQTPREYLADIKGA